MGIQKFHLVDNMKKRDEVRDVESFLREEMRYLDVDGTAIPLANVIDRALARDKEKRRFSTG